MLILATQFQLSDLLILVIERYRLHAAQAQCFGSRRVLQYCYKYAKAVLDHLVIGAHPNVPAPQGSLELAACMIAELFRWTEEVRGSAALLGAYLLHAPHSRVGRPSLCHCLRAWAEGSSPILKRIYNVRLRPLSQPFQIIIIIKEAAEPHPSLLL